MTKKADILSDPDPEQTGVPPADYVHARNAVDHLVHHVPADRWSATTPCPDWTVRELVGHLADGQHLLCRLADGDAWATESDPGRLAGDDPVSAWQAAVMATQKRLDSAALAASVSTPAGEVVLGEFLGHRVSLELLVHAWDLARATGLQVPAEGALAHRLHSQIAPFDEQLRGPGRYGPAQHTTSTDELDHLVAFLGRAVD